MAVPVTVPDAGYDRDDPVTFHRVMQSMVGDGLKARYVPPKKLSHELFVLMLQLREQEQRELKAQQRKAKPQKAKPPKSKPQKSRNPEAVAASA